ncbi:hypothetical protein SUDANB171_03405 [Streptomyces sp. enrichment culture]|uniref:DUF4255 domain-containing protein n=1 Tax=Streptomyces xiamenensis TaxID=408015 RepID=UPI0037D94476
MIHEVDEVLKGLLGGGALTGSGIDVSFEVPSRDWAARRNGPVINAYLYDIREDTGRRHRGQVAVRDDRDITVQRREPPRWLRLSYLVTAWTKQPEDEHRLLSAVLATLLPRDTLHPSELPDSLRALGMPVPLTVAGPHGEARSLADIWSALGGELKPSVDVTLTAPFPLSPEYDVAPPIKEAVVRVRGMSDEPSAAEERAQRPLTLPKPRAGGARELRPIRRTRAVRRRRAT